MMLEQLRRTCRALLEEGKVRAVVAYGRPNPQSAVCPVFLTRPDDVNRLVWNDQCVHNLVTYLTRKEIRLLGPIALVVKPCDERALVVLQQESQIDRSQLVVIGMACEGLGQPAPEKCLHCETHMPRFADIVIGQAQDKILAPEHRYQALDALDNQSPEQRLAYWTAELSRCVKCYACRQVCPLCYCERCLVEDNHANCVTSSASLKGNFAWHMIRAFHLAGRCVGCDECTRACPAGIELRLLNQAAAKTAEAGFQYRSGLDPDAEPLIGCYSPHDQEDFIR